MGPGDRVAAEERGCVLGKARASWGREGLGKHVWGHLQPDSEPPPAEENQKILTGSLLHADLYKHGEHLHCI